MTYDKPKVTIDLDEYNDLLALKNKPMEDGELLAKTVICEIFNSNGDVKYLNTRLIEKGIVMNRPNVQIFGEARPENIIISRIKK